MEPIRYQLVGDGSGHNYAIPVKALDEWFDWMESEEADAGGNPPEWAIRVEGNFTFADPRA